MRQIGPPISGPVSLGLGGRHLARRIALAGRVISFSGRVVSFSGRWVDMPYFRLRLIFGPLGRIGIRVFRKGGTFPGRAGRVPFRWQSFPAGRFRFLVGGSMRSLF